MIPYGRQSVSAEDIAAVIEVLRGDWLTQGPSVERFESAIADYVGADFAVAYSSGTAALHGALWAAGIAENDVVATSALTFMASANCIRYVGGTPLLVDINPTTLSIDLQKVPKGLKGLVAVHYAGLPLDLKQLSGEARPSVIIEDAAHALGALTPYGPVGNCAHSDLCCFSFHPVKPITTAEGGLVTTNNSDLAARLRRFRTHGIVPTPDIAPWAYSISEVGFNYRLTDLQAALGLSQVRQLEDFIVERNQIASLYSHLLGELEIVLPPVANDGFRHGYHLYVVRTRRRNELYAALHSAGIRAQVHYVPVHHHPVSKDCLIPEGGLPCTDHAYSEVLSLPIFPGLEREQIQRVTEVVQSVVSVSKSGL